MIDVNNDLLNPLFKPNITTGRQDDAGLFTHPCTGMDIQPDSVYFALQSRHVAPLLSLYCQSRPK